MINIEISYNKMSGIASNIWLKTSGGVNIAATIKITIITYLLLLAKEFDPTKPIKLKIISITGS